MHYRLCYTSIALRYYIGFTGKCQLIFEKCGASVVMSTKHNILCEESVANGKFSEKERKWILHFSFGRDMLDTVKSKMPQNGKNYFRRLSKHENT